WTSTRHWRPGPDDEWRGLRERVRAELDRHGVTDGHFSQHYATSAVDVSLLLLPQGGIWPPDAPRMLANVAALDRDLLQVRPLLRYRTSASIDGLPGSEAPFVACSFWLVEQYASSGRLDDARALMDRLCALGNDVGMVSEEYVVGSGRHAGNTPQA